MFRRPARNVTHKKLTLDPKDSELFHLVVTWLNEQWGYIEDYTDVVRERAQESQGGFYILMYGILPVGMFSLRRWGQEVVEKNLGKTVLELDYVFIIERLREQGFGSLLIKQAKEIARSVNAQMLVLQTLNPSLNGFYLKQKPQGSVKEICGYRYRGYPTTFISMDVDYPTEQLEGIQPHKLMRRAT